MLSDFGLGFEKTQPMLLPTPVLRSISQFAVSQLAVVDYSIANKVTEDVAHTVSWAYSHDLPWVATMSIQLLQSFDTIGATLIAIVVWIIQHTP